MNRYSIFNQNV